LGHGIARVHGQVEHHLLNLAGIGLDLPEVGRQIRGQIDVLADESAEHLLKVGNQVVEVEDLWGHQLFAAKGEELPSQGGSLQAGLFDILETFMHLARLQFRPIEKQLRIAGDHS